MSDYVGKVTAWNGHPLYEGRPAGSMQDPIGTVGDAVFNAGYDAIDTFQGLGTMGSAFTGRAYEMLPFVPGGLQSPIRPEDMSTLGEMGKAIIGNYQSSYVDPIMQGRPLDIGRHAIAHPVNTLLDVSGVGSLLQIPKLMGRALATKAVQGNAVVQNAKNVANKLGARFANAIDGVSPEAAQQTAEAQSLLATAQQAAQMASDKAKQAAAEAEKAAAQQSADAAAKQANAMIAEQAAQAAARQMAQAEAALKAVQGLGAKVGTAVGDLAQQAAEQSTTAQQVLNQIEQVVPLTKSGKLAQDIGKNFAGGVMADDMAFQNELGRLWKAIPPGERNQVKAWAEGWHPQAQAGNQPSPAIQAYLAKAEEYSAQMRDRIKGFVDDKSLSLDKYQPAALKLNGISGAEYKAMSLQQQQALLEQTKQMLEAKGIHPQYSAHVLANEARGTIEKMGTLEGKFIHNELAQAKQAKLTGRITNLQTELLDLEAQAQQGGTAEQMLELAKKIQKVEGELRKKATEKAGFLKTKQTAGDKAIDSHYDALRTRWIQISQFQHAYKNLIEGAIDQAKALDILANAPDVAARQAALNLAKKAAEDAAVELAAKEAAALAAKLAAERAAKEAEEAAKQVAQAAAKKAKQAASKAQSAKDAAALAQAAADQAIKEALEAKKAADMTAAVAKQIAKEAEKALKSAQKAAQNAAGTVPVNGPKLVKTILGGLQGSVLSEQELALLASALLPEKIELPAEFKRALDIALKRGGVTASNPIIRAYDEAVKFSKRYMLGGNLTYGLAQGVQSVYMLELVAMNGPRSALTHLMSYYLAFNKDVRAAVPISVAEDVLSATITSKHYIEDALNFTFGKAIEKTPGKVQPYLKGMISAYDRFVDFNLKVGQVFDSFVRAKAGVAHALMIAQEKTPLGQAVREMMDTAKSAQLVNQTFLDPAAEMAIAQQVNHALGNFAAIGKEPGMRLVGRIMPFPGWLKHISGYVAKLPANHPYKTILGNNLAQLQALYVADPDVPNYLKGTVRLSAPGPNGLPTVANKEAMNPITSVADIGEVVQSIFTGTGDKNMAQMLTAPLQLGLIIFLNGREQPMTGKPFKDPNLVEIDGKQYLPADAQRVVDGLQEPWQIHEQKPLPDDLLLRTFMPPLAKQTETFLEKLISNGQRSQMSGIFYRAPKRERDDSIRQAPDWITLMIQQLVNFSPLEYDPNMQYQEQKSANQWRHQAARQLSNMDNR